ncbi:MAG: TetR/AcrR family transcriptional regulator [Alphaproteobacteria bacterium]|nr:TetR/AcrR family transcriptional regulator [Alphaproteobacteria bacterium]
MSGTATLPSSAGTGEARGKREQNKATNRQAILAAAREVFSELGYGATTVRDIIRRTGLAAGTFYNYYRSKEEVFEALLDDMAARVRPRLTEARERAGSFEAYVSDCFRVFFAFCCEDRHDFDMLRSNADHVRVRMDTRETEMIVAEIHADLARAAEEGRLEGIDVDFLTAAMVGVGREMAEQLVLREAPDVEAAAAFATRFVLGGVAALTTAKG